MKKILIYGASSQARIVIKMIEELCLGEIVLIYDPTLPHPSFSTSVRFSNKKEELNSLISELKIDNFHVCIGNTYGFARVKISEYLLKQRIKPLSIISKNAIIDETANLNSGVLIMPGAIVHKYAFLGDYTLINSGAIIEHEVYIGNGVHVMSGSVITGRAKLDDYSTIGANSTILPDVVVGKDAIVGAGGIAVKDVPPSHIVVGTPAIFLKNHHVKEPIY
jgi:sugar O-acyltransferase (sialic acid O-acetyltransferase NeuD family)